MKKSITKKIAIMSKYALLGVFLQCLLFTLLFASNSTAQLKSMQDIKVNINMHGKLKDVFKEIENISEFRFSYNKSRLDVSQYVKVLSIDESLSHVLLQISEQTNLKFKRINESIHVTQLLRQEKRIEEQIGVKQTHKISGKVTSFEDGEELPGVNVIEKGTNNGTVTDVEGSYSLTVSEGATIVFSSVGYTSEEISVENNTVINVTLTPDIKQLQELVVIGYGTVKKSDLTGSVSSVKTEEIENLPVRSLSEALSGRIPGVYVTKGSGEPGADSDIIIRGAASINGIKPLYIVDGVRMGTGNNFNMADVESIEILKDASSAAIYGVEAAGGVILVTTKSGKTGEKMQVNFDTYVGQRSALNLPQLLNRADYIEARKIVGVEYDSWNSNTTDTDWIDEMYGKGLEQNYNLSLSGGTDRSTYFISGNFQNEEGIRRANWFERMSFRINSDHKLNSKFKVGQYLYIARRAWRPKGDGSDGNIPYRSIPLMPVYDESRPGGWGGAPDGFQGANMVGVSEYRIYDNSYVGVEGNLYLDWNILEGLNFRSTFGGYTGGDNLSKFDRIYDFGIIKNGVPKLEKELKRNQNVSANFVLTYDKSFGYHDLKLMAGWEALKNSGTNVFAKTQGFPVEYSPSFGLSTQSRTAREADASFGKGSQVSQFGRINYGFMGKYLLQATIRRDGTNKFIGENLYGVFPSFSGAWRLSEESFLQDQSSWLSNLKLRAGWGVLGSIASVPDFVYEEAYGSINVHSFDGTNVVTGWGNKKFPNKDIKWETVTTTNIGFDFGFLDDKLSITADWFDRRTSDMIYQVALPPSAGIGGHNSEYKATINIGEIENKGFEFDIDWRDRIGELSYGIGANASFIKNKVIRIGEEGALIYRGGAAYLNGSISRTEDGYPMGQFYGYVVDGIFKTDAEAAASAQPNAKAGDLIYRDIAGNEDGTPDGRITNADKTYIGNPWPKSFFGVNMDLDYKGFDLRLSLTGQAGNKIFNSTKSIRQSFYGDWNTTSEIFNTSFFGNNEVTNLPRVYHINGENEYLRDPNGNYKNISSYFVENGSYLKIRDIQIGYTLPKNLTDRVSMNSARIYVSGYNLITFTKYSGLDPELGGDVKERGIETDGLYPQTRLVSVGLDISF